jgi:spore coat protein CotH
MYRIFFLCMGLLVLISHSSTAQVVINELLYHDSATSLEFVELYNPSQSPVDMSGWVLKDNNDAHQFVFPQHTTISAGGYFIIANDPVLFSKAFVFPPQLTGIDFAFSNEGDSVRLYDASGNIIEALTYDDRGDWPEEADGEGSTLERINEKIPATYPQAWAASVNRGTPGVKNSVYQSSLPPLIIQIDHTPKIPAPSERITVTARILNIESPIDSVSLHYGWNGTNYRSTPMHDDGEHGDGLANDGVYGVEVPGSQARNIFCFYVEAKNTAGLQSRLPQEASTQPYMTVVESPITNELVNIFRVVMLPTVRERFLARYQTDEYFPACFYDNNDAYYNVHIRHRGRSRVQNGRFKIRFDYNNLFRGTMRRINFNGTDKNWILREYLSFQMFYDAGLPSLESEIVRFHINGETTRGIPYRVCIENPDSQFLRRKDFFENDNGNLYKTNLDNTPDNKATWRYVGDDPDLYRFCYIKQTNEEEDDFSDVIELSKVLTENRPEDPDYMDTVYSVLNMENFSRWMAVAACVDQWDSPLTDHGHNYVLYNNPSNGQFYVIPWDLNGTFRYGTNPNDLGFRKEYTHIRSTKFDAVNQIFNHPYFGAQYYREIDNLMNTLFSEEAMAEKIEDARQKLKASTSEVSFLKSYVTMRRRDMAHWIDRDKGMSFVSKPVYQTFTHEVYRYPLSVADYRGNGGLTYSIKQGPSWLSIDAKKGLVTGTPTTEGNVSIVLAAKARNGVEIEQAYTLQITNPKPRLLLNFNQSGTTVYDSSPFRHNGNLSGTARKQSGRLGNGLYLDGRQGRVLFKDTDNSLDLSGSVTVEAWIKPSSQSSGNPVIITKGTADAFNYILMLGYGPFSGSSNEPCFMPHPFDGLNRAYYGRKEIEARLRSNQWVHVAGSYDSATELVSVYVNNRCIVYSANRCQMEANNMDLQIGLATSRGYVGMVDDVKILPFAKQHFAAGLCLSEVQTSGISAACDSLTLSLAAIGRSSIDTQEFCLYRQSTDEWIPLPQKSLESGKSTSWWLDDLGVTQPLAQQEILALYPLESMGAPLRSHILDQVVWGDFKPTDADPGVQAGVWMIDSSIPLANATSKTIRLKDFADNDESAQDWEVIERTYSGPVVDSLQINGGNATTTTRTVQISIKATGLPYQMRISNSPVFSANWQSYQSNLTWELSEQDGQKTIYIQLQNHAGERSAIKTASIQLNANTAIQQWKTY